MRIQSNHIYSIISFFHSELDEKYGKNEVDSFIRLAFESIIHFSPIQLSMNKNETVSESVLLKFNNVVKQLRQNKPIQYILGEAYFYDMLFFVDENVLIPRPETEELVKWIVEDNKANNNIKILDIGTGSGAIAISLKKNIEKSIVFACDISEKALDVARENAKRNDLLIEFDRCDILNSSMVSKHKYDIIVSNPPYVMNKEKVLMADNVLKYEPELALFVEDSDPLLFYREILKKGRSSLNNGGYVYFEINELLGQEMIALCKSEAYTEIELRKDFAGKDRMLRARF
ncbi:MAG: peptide chain release factor N(5)-glutamine methyltransferase [Bacteroidota bacterium]